MAFIIGYFEALPEGGKQILRQQILRLLAL